MKPYWIVWQLMVCRRCGFRTKALFSVRKLHTVVERQEESARWWPARSAMVANVTEGRSSDDSMAILARINSCNVVMTPPIDRYLVSSMIGTARIGDCVRFYTVGKKIVQIITVPTTGAMLHTFHVCSIVVLALIANGGAVGGSNLTSATVKRSVTCANWWNLAQRCVYTREPPPVNQHCMEGGVHNNARYRAAGTIART